MSKPARRYDVYLPLTYNDGRSIPEGQFDAVEQRLVQRFTGVTSHQREFPLRGVWFGSTQLYLDQVIIMTALDFRRAGSQRFIVQLKQDLLRDFEQVEVLITESETVPKAPEGHNTVAQGNALGVWRSERNSPEGAQ